MFAGWVRKADCRRSAIRCEKQAEEKVMQDKTKKQIRERLLGDEKARARVSLCAYELYERRGCGPGCQLEDWLQAESCSTLSPSMASSQPEILHGWRRRSDAEWRDANSELSNDKDA